MGIYLHMYAYMYTCMPMSLILRKLAAIRFGWFVNMFELTN